MALWVGQELAGEWTGRGASLLGLPGTVTEAEMEALFGQGLHPHQELLAPGVPAVILERLIELPLPGRVALADLLPRACPAKTVG